MVNNKVVMPDSKCLSLPRSTHPSEAQVRNGPSQTGWMSVRVNLRIPSQLQKYLKTSSPSSDSLCHANTGSQQLWTSITGTDTREKPSHSRPDSFWRVVSETPGHRQPFVCGCLWPAWQNGAAEEYWCLPWRGQEAGRERHEGVG